MMNSAYMHIYVYTYMYMYIFMRRTYVHVWTCIVCTCALVRGRTCCLLCVRFIKRLTAQRRRVVVGPNFTPEYSKNPPPTMSGKGKGGRGKKGKKSSGGSSRTPTPPPPPPPPTSPPHPPTHVPTYVFFLFIRFLPSYSLFHYTTIFLYKSRFKF